MEGDLYRAIEQGVASVLTGSYMSLRPDAAQEAYLRLQRWRRGDLIDNPKTVGYRAGVWAALNELEREKRHHRGRIPMTSTSELGDTPEDLDNAFSDQGRFATSLEESVTAREAFSGAYSALTKRQKRIWPYVLMGFKQVEVGRLFNLRPSTVFVEFAAIYKAIKALLPFPPDDPSDPTDRPPASRRRKSSRTARTRQADVPNKRSHNLLTNDSLLDTAMPKGLVNRFLELTLRLPAFAEFHAEETQSVEAPIDLYGILNQLGLLVTNSSVEVEREFSDCTKIHDRGSNPERNRGPELWEAGAGYSRSFPKIVHFSGHGSVEVAEESARLDVELMVDCEKVGAGVKLPPAELAGFCEALLNSSPRLLFLAACRSRPETEAQHLSAYLASHWISSEKNTGIIDRESHKNSWDALTERVFFDTCIYLRIGEVPEAPKTWGWTAQEQERGITVTSAAAACFWRENLMNLIALPSRVDFTAEVRRSLVGHGKASLSAVLLSVLAHKGARVTAFDQIDKAPGTRERITIATVHMGYELADLYYPHLDFPDHLNVVNYFVIAQANDLIWVVSEVDGPTLQSRKHILPGRQVGVPSILVVPNKCVIVDTQKLFVLWELELREPVPYNELRGNDNRFVRDSLINVWIGANLRSQLEMVKSRWGANPWPILISWSRVVALKGLFDSFRMKNLRYRDLSLSANFELAKLSIMSYLVEMQLGELLWFYEFPGAEIPIISDSALKAFEKAGPADDWGSKAIDLIENFFSYIPMPECEIDKGIQDHYHGFFGRRQSGDRPYQAGRVPGWRGGGDPGYLRHQKTIGTGIVEKLRKLVDYWEAGTNEGLLLRGFAVDSDANAHFGEFDPRNALVNGNLEATTKINVLAGAAAGRNFDLAVLVVVVKDSGVGSITFEISIDGIRSRHRERDAKVRGSGVEN